MQFASCEWNVAQLLYRYRNTVHECIACPVFSKPVMHNRAMQADVQGKVKTFEKAFILHQNLVKAVAADPHLKQLAADAFRSFVRAYSTHSKPLKDIFAVYQLHLGHVAHSFALRYAAELFSNCSGISQPALPCCIRQVTAHTQVTSLGPRKNCMPLQFRKATILVTY